MREPTGDPSLAGTRSSVVGKIIQCNGGDKTKNGPAQTKMISSRWRPLCPLGRPPARGSVTRRPQCCDARSRPLPKNPPGAGFLVRDCATSWIEPVPRLDHPRKCRRTIGGIGAQRSTANSAGLDLECILEPIPCAAGIDVVFDTRGDQANICGEDVVGFSL
jgi:hypothetical protein